MIIVWAYDDGPNALWWCGDAEARRCMGGGMSNTDLDTCLCCGQPVTERGKPITPERALKALKLFLALGLSREDLLTKHRAQLEYQSPGFVAWLEGAQ
jgi:hypothetical protein